MKCPRCWAYEAYRHPQKGWAGVLLRCLLLVPLKCHHCYHNFTVFWPFTLGQQVSPPPMRKSALDSAGRLRAGRRMAVEADGEELYRGESGTRQRRKRAA